MQLVLYCASVLDTTYYIKSETDLTLGWGIYYIAHSWTNN